MPLIYLRQTLVAPRLFLPSSSLCPSWSSLCSGLKQFSQDMIHLSAVDGKTDFALEFKRRRISMVKNLVCVCRWASLLQSQPRKYWTIYFEISILFEIFLLIKAGLLHDWSKIDYLRKMPTLLQYLISTVLRYPVIDQSWHLRNFCAYFLMISTISPNSG